MKLIVLFAALALLGCNKAAPTVTEMNATDLVGAPGPPDPLDEEIRKQARDPQLVKLQAVVDDSEIRRHGMLADTEALEVRVKKLEDAEFNRKMRESH